MRLHCWRFGYFFFWMVSELFIDLRIRLKQWVGQGLVIICKLKPVKDTVVKVASLGASALISVFSLTNGESSVCWAVSRDW